jgi:hypothetical protein
MLNTKLLANAFMGKETTKIDQAGVTEIKNIPRNALGRGGVVVKALRYKPAGRGFDSRWRHWNFSVT